jgi:putative hydrolase of the HAD superfamily
MFNDFIPIFNDIFDEDKGIVALIARLKNKYKLGLISNTNPIHSSHVVEKYLSLGHFDRLWFSNEAGLRKPNPAIYTMALDHFNIKPSEAVFIDDMEINIASARNVGMHGIHYQGILMNLENELRRIGVEH